MKTTRQILKGLRLRLEMLKKAESVLSRKKKRNRYPVEDFRSRIDEIEELIRWIKTGK